MDIVINFLMSTNIKSGIYHFIIVIINQLTKTVQYKLIKAINNVFRLVKVIFNIIFWYHSFLNSILNNQKLIFTLKYQFFFCYFFTIKKKRYVSFYLETDG